MSKDVLEAIPYHSEQKNVDFEKSSIRSWLNSDFFFAAFTGNERLCILNSKVNTPKNIEYVLVHELCHLVHPNHSKQFYTFLTMFMPDWKERKTELEKNCILWL